MQSVRIKESENVDVFLHVILHGVVGKVHWLLRSIKSSNTTVSKTNVLSDAVDIAGGAKVLRGPVTFLRFNNDGTIDKRKFGFSENATRGSYKNPYLRSGDLIVIGDSALTNINSIITEFTSPIVGIFSTYGLIKAMQN